MNDDQIRTRKKVKVMTGDAEIGVKPVGNVEDTFNMLRATFGIHSMIWSRVLLVILI